VSRAVPRPSVRARFDRQGRAGWVRAYYDRTESAAASGFPTLVGWERATDAGVGFPRLRVEVTSDRPGYGAILGWIQWVTQEFPSDRTKVRLVDRLPALLDRDVPFLAYGFAPTFFDAPAYNSHPAVDWRASAWLCSVPMMSRREPIVPLFGLTWGYRIAENGAEPVPHPILRATASEWRTVRAELARRHPAWRFASRYRPAPRTGSRSHRRPSHSPASRSPAASGWGRGSAGLRNSPDPREHPERPQGDHLARAPGSLELQRGRAIPRMVSVPAGDRTLHVRMVRV
jgi:hypothetical protein